MNIYEKLQKCRVELQDKGLKKSGKNEFSGYDYFELSDFLPSINKLFLDHKLCSIVTFDKNIATLTIINAEKPDESLVFTSPMETATLKGCHPVQNLGAVETYQRRYLYMAALEIVESDILDKGINKESTQQKQSNKSNPTTPQTEKLICLKCKKEITKAEYDYSIKQFKYSLCKSCQALARKAIENASTTNTKTKNTQASGEK